VPQTTAHLKHMKSEVSSFQQVQYYKINCAVSAMTKKLQKEQRSAIR